MDLYMGKTKDRKYSFPLGLKIVLGAAKGLAHMHAMPAPFVHRDVKSGNIMVMGEGEEEAGKLGDCGESRRVDLNATMTRTGSPLWAAVGGDVSDENQRYKVTIELTAFLSPRSSQASTTARTSIRTPLASSCSRLRCRRCRTTRSGKNSQKVEERASTPR